MWKFVTASVKKGNETLQVVMTQNNNPVSQNYDGGNHYIAKVSNYFAIVIIIL